MRHKCVQVLIYSYLNIDCIAKNDKGANKKLFELDLVFYWRFRPLWCTGAWWK